MYQVSENYIAAMRANSITDRVYGRIFLKSGTAIDITDENIAQGKLTITRKVCGSTLKIGTFYISTMSITLFDDAAYDNEWAGAMIVLKYSVLIDKANDVWEDVPLGPFFVDGKESKRRRGQITLTAYDNASKFDIALPDLSAVTTLWGALQAAYYKANVGIAMSEDEFNALPNATITPDFSSEKIQSCRDLVMWIAQAVGGYAYINNQGLLTIKRYTYDGGNSYDRLVAAEERTDIEYTDTRTYLAYLSAYCEGKPKSYTEITTWTGTDASHTKEGALSLSDNPLFSALSADEQDAANAAILSARPYPTRYIKAQGFIDPAIEPLDTLAFSGGNIDIGQLISTCTEIKWKFRGIGSVICNNFEEYSEDASETAVSLTAEADDSSDASSNVIARVPPKSQLEKRVDEIESKLGSGTDIAKALQSDGGAKMTTLSNGFTVGSIVVQGSNSLMLYCGGAYAEISSVNGITITHRHTGAGVSISNSGLISVTSGSSKINVTADTIDVKAGTAQLSIGSGSSLVCDSTGLRINGAYAVTS